MAQAVRFVCNHCHHAIEAWSDGNPYYIDENGKKQYAYHPDHEKLAKCIWNDVPHLCLACGNDFNEDSREPRGHCPRCKESGIAETWELGGKTCPFCREGRFEEDREFFAIS